MPHRPPATLLLTLSFTLWACQGEGPERTTGGTGDAADGRDGSDGSDGGAGDGTADGGDGGSVTLSPTCDGFEVPWSDPFTLVGSEINTQEGGPPDWFTEILDLTYLPEEDRVVTAGQGGVVVFDVTDPTAPDTRGYIGAGGAGLQRYYHVLPARPGLAWATHRDLGLHTLDLSDADDLAELSHHEERGYEGLVRDGSWLYVASTRGFVDVFSLADDTAPRFTARIDDLGRPWDVAVADGWLYVADADGRIGVVSVADPAAPGAPDFVEAAATPHRVVTAEGHLYLTSGAGGLQVFSLETPDAPAQVASRDVGGGALDVAVADGLVGVTTQEAVVLLDIGRAGTPSQPLPFAYEETEQFAMAVHAAAGRWVVGDWNILGVWQAGEETAPAADLSHDLLAFIDGPGATLTVRNRGGAPLRLHGLELPDGLSATAEADTVPVDGSVDITLTWDEETPIDGQDLCLASDDPSRPRLKLPVTSGGDGVGRVIGQQAPDFSLVDLDGNTRRLSEQLGHPVVLAYFATW